MTRVRRSTRETTIEVTLRLGTGPATIATGEPFLDHMLTTLARYAGLELTVAATGDLRHHVIEDVAITLGEALRQSVPAGCRRFGDCTLPMDDALVQAAVDVGGRCYYRGRLPSEIYGHWMRSFAAAALITLHLRVLRGRDRHHVVEAAFKALGLALRDALADGGAPLSTKGTVALEVDAC
jgi:imidazoleglycerol-phosphate dehydratase